MNGDIREPDPADDDDIPILTEIVVPGRLQAEASEVKPAGQVAPEFVFDIDFSPRDMGSEQRYDFRAAEQLVAPEPEGMPEPPPVELAQAPLESPDAELPLPWAAQAPPGSAPGAPPAPIRDESDPLIVAAFAKSAAAQIEPLRIEPPDPDAQALLRALLAEIGSGLEQRLHEELALTEQRLRAALREELDTRLRELLAGTPPTA